MRIYQKSTIKKIIILISRFMQIKVRIVGQEQRHCGNTRAHGFRGARVAFGMRAVQRDKDLFFENKFAFRLGTWNNLHQERMSV